MTARLWTGERSLVGGGQRRSRPFADGGKARLADCSVRTRETYAGKILSSASPGTRGACAIWQLRPEQAVMDRAVKHLVTNYSPERPTRRLADDRLDPGRSLGSLFDRLRADLPQASLSSVSRCAGSGRGRHAGRRDHRCAGRRMALGQDRPARDVSVDDDHVRRPRPRPGLRAQHALAGGDSPPSRHSARQRHLQRLHLHHGVPCRRASAR